MRLKLKTAFITLCIALATIVAPRPAHAQVLYCYQLWDFMLGNGGFYIYERYLGGGWWLNTIVIQGQTAEIACLG